MSSAANIRKYYEALCLYFGETEKATLELGQLFGFMC